MKPKPLVVLALWGCGAPLFASATRPEVRGLLPRVPLHFERNDGQADPRVRFLARGPGYGLYLTEDEAVLALVSKHDSQPEVLRWRLMGGRSAALVTGEEPLPGKANSLLGNDPSRWRRDVPLYGRVRYADVYLGISLSYYGDQRHLEYDLELEPGADPRAIRFRIEGAKSIRLDDAGRLRIRTARGEVVQQPPVVYQLQDGERRPVPAGFRRIGRRDVGFTVASYDRKSALVIDPKIEFETYLGGTVADEAADVAVAGLDSNLEVYVVGTTASVDFKPTLSMVSQGRSRAGNDIFVVKMRFTAGALAVSYATYMGGDADDRGVAIALESDGQAVVAAQTNSSDIFANRTFGLLGGIDVWIGELNSSGTSLNYAARLGGDKTDIPRDVAVSGGRDVFVVGLTQSGNYPIASSDPAPIQGSLKGSQDAFFTILVASATSMSYSTYMGGGGVDEANGIVLASTETYIVGTTDSDDFPLKNPIQDKIGGGSAGVNDAFVMDFSPFNLSRNLSASTYYGGKLRDSGLGIAADAVGDVYITGETESDDFPAVNPFQGRLGGSFDAFVAKLERGVHSILWSTYLGGTAFDSGQEVAVDPTRHVYVTGATSSDDFPVRRPLDPPNDKLQGATDAFLTKLVPTGCTLDYSTYIGGKTVDEGAALALTSSGSAVVVGRTDSSDLQQVLPVAPFGGGFDGFAAFVSDDAPPADLEVRKTASPDPAIVGANLTYTVTLRNLSSTRPAYGIQLVDDLPPVGAVTFLSSTPGAPTCTLSGQQLSCSFSCLDPLQEITVTIDVKVQPPAFSSITNRATIFVPEDPNSLNDSFTLNTTVVNPADLEVVKVKLSPATPAVGDQITYQIDITNHGPAGANNVVMTDVIPPGTTYVETAPPCLPPVGNVLTCPTAGLANGSNVTRTLTVLATGAGVVTNTATVAADEPDIVPANNSSSATTTVVVPVGAVQFFTVRSATGENFLEWQNPAALSPSARIVIHRTQTAGDCVFETDPLAPSPLHVEVSPPADAYDNFPDNTVTDGTTYCYSIFVDPDGSGSSFSSGRFNRGRPFDSVSGKVRWEFNIGTSSLAPVGNGAGIVHSVANDANLYAMVKDVAGPGASGGGRWPPAYRPFPISGPSQGRPGSVPIFPPGHATFLSSDDGHVYAIDSDHGNLQPLLWVSSVLGGAGTILTAPPSGSFTQFGATRDLIYVGSRDPAGSQLFALNLSDGQSTAPGWAKNGTPFGKIGPVSGQAAVDYGTKRVYFASRAFGGSPDDNTVWCVDFETGVIQWAVAHGDIDAGVSLRGNHLYVATNDGRVLALNTANGGVDWTFTVPAGESAAKGYVVLDNQTPNLYFSTLRRVWALRDNGGSFTSLWPGGVLLPGGIPNNFPSTPVFIPGGTFVWVGGSDSRLHRLNVANGSGFDSFFLGTPAIVTAVGSPTIDLRAGFVYVGTEAGRVYAIQP